MSSQHYALVSKASCPPLKIADPEDDASNNNANSKNVNVRDELVAIYETYADMYPNPKLAEENRQRDTLLQAARAASTYQHDQEKEGSNKKKKKKSSGGFFSFLFGGSGNDDATGNDPKQYYDTQGVVSNDDEDDALLSYHDTPNPLDDDRLCGTQHSIDVTCIPEEVYSVSRSHLTSTRTRRDHPNALRFGPSTTSSSSSAMYIVVGLGEIAEFRDGNNDDDEQETGASPCILATSDRDELLGYAERTGEFQLHNARGAVLSENCIAVSWGFLDGITVFYRRIQVPGYLNGHGWEAVWMLGPSTPVLDSMSGEGQDLFHDDAEQPGSPLLRISDCLPLSVQMQSNEQLEQEASNDNASQVITLAVSRLGGYIELVPLPTKLWAGSLLTPNNYRPQKHKSPKRKRGQHQLHYAMGKSIACPPQTVALTTGEHHVDIQAMEAYRTCVNSETVWNDQEYPESPPAEFILASSGVSREGREAMTFWTVSTLFPDTPNPQDEIEFGLHSSLIEVVSVSTGSSVTVFASSGIMRRWRTPRQVELKESAIATDGSTSVDSSGGQQPAPRVTTLSTSAPIVRMCFSDSDGSSSTHSGPFLSVMDWNGGVQILDCSIMGRAAVQNMPLHEYEQYRSANDQQQQAPFSLVTRIISRGNFSNSLQKVEAQSVDNLRWLGGQGLGTEGTMPPLVLLTDKSRRLVVSVFNLPEEEAVGPGTLLDSSILSLEFPASGAVMKGLDDSNMAFVGVQKGKSKTARHRGRLLRCFVMEQLQPVAIVETLARDSKFHEAIEAASKLPPHEQAALVDVVSRCHRRLWETKRDVHSLEELNDASYVIREAVSLFDEEKSLEGMTLEKLHSVLKLALSCGERSKDSHGTGKIREMIVRLGTYKLLCRHFGSRPSLRNFQQSFVNADVFELSKQVAQRGDITAMSVLLFRHRNEIGEKAFDVLSSLPISLHPDFYCHLIPVIRNDSFSDFFLGPRDGDAEIPWSHMPQYLSETEGTSIVLGLVDEKAVLDYSRGLLITKDSGNLETLAADWFLARGKLTQTLIGNIDGVIRLCELGVKCLSQRLDDANLAQAVPAVKQLYRTWQSALSLQRMILDEVVAIDGDGIDTDGLMQMSLVELLDLVLNSEADTSMIMYRFKEYVQPLMLESSSSGMNDGSTLDDALSSYCINEARKCWDSSLPAAKAALASCAAVAQCSKPSLPRERRLIKQESVLVDMVLKVSMEILKVLSRIPVQAADQRELLRAFWSLYETCPVELPKDQPDLDGAVNALYKSLVTMDILIGWPGCRPFPTVLKLDEVRTAPPDIQTNYRQDAMSGICKSFLELVGKLTNTENKTSLLNDLASDLESLNKTSFESSVNVASTLCEHIIPELLAQGSFELVANLLGLGGPAVDRKQIEQAVLDYVDEAAFSEIETENTISRAIRCQDVLGPLFPEAQSNFQSIRRFLDASHFVATVIFDGKNLKPIHPMDFKNMNGPDAIETVLQSVPESVVCGCPQWMDALFAVNANGALRDAAKSTQRSPNEQSSAELPVLPGGAIFHLATILGLEDGKSAMAVKCRVIFYAMKCEFYGAAAAVARTLLYDEMSPVADNLDLAKLAAIAEVVKEEKYHDQTTKKELCDIALVRFRASLSATNSAAFDTLLQISSQLDISMSRFNQAFHEISPERKETLLSRPLARLYKHIFYEYNSDVYSLFLDLTAQAEQQEVHDSLVNALSRFVIYWCIHDSKTLKRFVNLWDRADAIDNLALGCSLLLQIPSNLTATNCVNELQKIAADQAANVSTEERFGTSASFCDPDPDLVQRLIGRGYSENGARRAVMMTGNSGYNDALGYAVMHTMDPDFNQPLAVLKRANRLCIDEEAMQLLQKSLIQVSRILEDPSHRSKLVAYLSSQHQNMEIDSAQATKMTRSAGNTQKLPPLQVKRALPPPPQQKRTPPAASLNQPSHNVSSKATSAATKPRSALVVPQQPASKTAARPSVPSKPAAPLKLQVAVPKSNGNHSDGNGSATIKTIKTTSPKNLDRDELKKRGQAALAKLRSTSTIGSRQRLLEEGRQLLKKSRSTASSTSTATNGDSRSKARPTPPVPQPNAARGVASSPAAKPSPKLASAPSLSRKPAPRVTVPSITSKPKPLPRSTATKITKINAKEEDAAEEDDGWDFDNF